MQSPGKNVFIALLATALLFPAISGRAEYLPDYAEARMSIALTIAHPVWMKVQSDIICLHNYADRRFSISQTWGTRAFDHHNSTPSRYHTGKDDKCKSGLTLQLDARPGHGEKHALLHVLIEPD